MGLSDSVFRFILFILNASGRRASRLDPTTEILSGSKGGGRGGRDGGAAGDVGCGMKWVGGS